MSSSLLGLAIVSISRLRLVVMSLNAFAKGKSVDFYAQALFTNTQFVANEGLLFKCLEVSFEYGKHL